MLRAPYLTASEASVAALLDESALLHNIDVQEMPDSEHLTFLADLRALQG
jgi:hypothetical protein